VGGAGQVGFGPLYRIDGPPPVAPLYGLLQTASAPAQGVRIVPDTDERGIERWMNGVEVYSYPPDAGSVWDTCSQVSPRPTKDFGGTLPLPQFGAFTAFLAETCTSYRIWDQDAYKARAVTAFAAVESAIVAKEFMTGAVMTANPHLSDGTGTFPNGDTVTSFPDGVRLLEKAIAATGKLGLIHCSPQLLSAAAAKYGWNYWRDSANQCVRMISGTVIVPDSGYGAGSTPTGHVAPTGSQEWIYATGPVDVRRSEIFVNPENVSQALDRGSGGATTGRSNSITYRAERYYLIDWDTELHAAVLVDSCVDTCAHPT